MTTTTETPASTTDRIEKRVTFDAARSRVWRALTDVAQFNTWFGAALESPFAPGAEVSGKLAFRGWEHVTLTLWIEAMEPERFFSFRWHPYPIDPAIDFAADPTTLVTFTLEEEQETGGTRLTIVESGFDAIPESRRATAFSMNTKGWTGQAENIRKFLAADGGAPEHDRLPHEGVV